MRKPKISIIVPCYNAEKYIEKCLDSIVNQTLQDIEVICINDGSTDNTLNILNNYKEKYDVVKVINQENKGVAATRSIGLKNATGDFVGWVDNDDFCNIDMYEKMYEKAIKENLDIVICNYNFYPDNNTKKEKWYKSYNGEAIDYKFIQHNTTLWNKIVRRELLEKLDISTLIKEIGEGCYSLVIINANKIGTIDECLYNYRVGHASLSANTKKVEWFEKTVSHQTKRLKYVKDNNYDPKWIEFYTYVYLYYVELLMIIGARNGRKDIYDANRKIIKDEKFISNKYGKYLKNSISLPKRIFFKFVAPNSYFLTKAISKIIL